MIDQNTLPTESLIAGTTRRLLFYLYTENKHNQIDATGMTARFSMTDYINDSDSPIFTKDCVITVPEGEECAIISVLLNRIDTLDLYGKYIYQVTVNDNGRIAVIKGHCNIALNPDKLTI